MTAADDTVVEAVHAARQSADFNEQIVRVKRAVGDEMRRIDPGLKITKTEYFNHSYVPDLIASWRQDGARHERGVFIRGSLRTVVAGNDLEGLADQAPVLVAISDDSEETWAALRRQIKRSNMALATEITATSRIRTVGADRGPESQLSALVTANLVRGGRGLLSETAADSIVAVERQDPRDALESFGTTVRELFVGEMAERLSRTAGLLQSFFDAALDSSIATELKERPLSDSELRVIVPYVVSRAVEVKDGAVWDLLGAMLSLETIESMGDALNGLNLTPLIIPVVHELVAARTGVFFNPEMINDEEMDTRPPSWLVRNGRLSADIRRWSLTFGSNGRKVRGRDSGPDARWSDLLPLLSSHDLVAADLRGLSKRFTIAATSDSTVNRDVEHIRETIDDDFHVSSVGVRAAGKIEAPTLKVEFGASTATGLAPLDYHVQVAQLLTLQRLVADEDIAALIANQAGRLEDNDK